MKHYCPIPFGHISVGTQGDYRICCQHSVPVSYYQNISSTSPDQWLQNPYLKEVQTSFEQDLRHPNCDACWREEDKGRHSLRLRVLKEYSIIGIKDYHKNVVNAEIQVGNLCNLTCIMCNETQSSGILSENRRLGINQIMQKDFRWDNKAWQNLTSLLESRLRVLNIRGGEPFYNKDLLRVIGQLPDNFLSTTMLHVSTNATTWNDQWKQAISKFRLVRIMFSIDAIGPVYEYIRHPAKWEQVSNNVIEIASLNNVNPVIHCVVQNLNIGHLEDLMSWCDQHQFYLQFDTVQGMDHLQVHNIPEQLRPDIMAQLDRCIDRAHKHQKSFLQSYLEILDSTPFDPVLWKKFKKEMELRESVRGNNHKICLNYTEDLLC